MCCVCQHHAPSGLRPFRLFGLSAFCRFALSGLRLFILSGLCSFGLFGLFDFRAFGLLRQPFAFSARPAAFALRRSRRTCGCVSRAFCPSRPRFAKWFRLVTSPLGSCIVPAAAFRGPFARLGRNSPLGSCAARRNLSSSPSIPTREKTLLF